MSALVLEDGEVFAGESIGAPGCAVGEAVFTTAMTGYQEIVTDPSYAGQIICFTAPMVGNYGVRDARSESTAVHAAGVIMREARGPEWVEWLRANGVPALTGVDTRSLVLHLRERGAMRAGIGVTLEDVRSSPSMTGAALAGRVSTRTPYSVGEGGVEVALVDYGVKQSIVRRLVTAGARVTVFPHDVDVTTLCAFDGVLLSNGPGDPEPLHAEVNTIRELLGRVPVLGICLGHQLLALATGLATFKLPFGHRGANHPVLDRASRRVLVTSQNHGFAVAPSETRAATHESLYDGTVEGLAYPELRARSVQFHPEAGPGPRDAWPLLSEWVEEVRRAAA